MNYDFTTLAGITAAANKLNKDIEAWGLDFDMEIHPEEGTSRIRIWAKTDGHYEIILDKSFGIVPETIAMAFNETEAWFDEYRLGIRNGLEKAVLDLQAELAICNKEKEEVNG